MMKKFGVMGVSLLLILFGMAGSNLFAGYASLTAIAQTKSQRNEVRFEENGARKEWNWRQSDGATDLEVKVIGEVRFTDDYTDVRSISENGLVRIEERRGPAERRYEVRPDQSGNLKHLYFVQGEARALDPEARNWIAGIMLEFVRQSGYDAPARVRKLLDREGAGAVLDEITKIRSDYAKRLYFEELLKSGRLDEANMRRAVRQSGSEIKSDYEKAQFLIQVAEGHLDDTAVAPSFFEAAGTINSDYEHGRVLAAVLKNKNLGSEILIATLKSAKSISSDYEKAGILIKIAEAYPIGDGVRPFFFAAVGTIGSDYEHGRALKALLDRTDVSKETLIQILKSTASITSDYEKSQVLLKVAAATSGDDALRTALLDAARTINSEYERGRVLSAVVYKDR